MINLNLPFFGKKGKIKVPIQKELEGFEKIKELMAPPGANFALDYFQIGDIYGRTLLVLEYPSYLIGAWLSKVIILDEPFNLSLFFYPIDTGATLKRLEKQLARIEAQIREREEKGQVRSPELETAYKNVEELRDLLVQAEERMLKVSLYITLFANDKKELDLKTKKLLKNFESSLISAKQVMFQQKEGFMSTLPLCLDEINTSYHLNSSTASSFFPFISTDIVDEKGIFMGINLIDGGVVILDRFKYENPHLLILARSGSGKSYTAKLEIMRSLMMNMEVIVLDPENEYKSICDVYGGSFIPLSLRADHNLNPFDLPNLISDENPYDVFKEHISNLIILIELLIGERLSSEELALVDRALNQTYTAFNILPERGWEKAEIFPTLNDFEKVLRSTVGGEKIADRLYPYVEGSFAGFLNKQTNVEIDNRLVVFGLKDLPEVLRPLGMFLALSFIINKIKREIKRRLLIIDEAWWIMKQPFGAEFLLNVIKRGRKYQLAVTNITQDVEDFLNSEYGKPIITNSAIIFLMKQSTATADLLKQIFYLSDGEKNFLVQAERGNGILIAGNKRVPLYVLASYAEDQIIKTRPDQLIALEKAKEIGF
ncbi:MAG: ATP-binding protein [Candidatus Pacebacteria bacterium]|jgi:type IV secretory pathway VirB4 component|nr:ATP-binding protein [Candidatus Paceibacterota bacterium]